MNEFNDLSLQPIPPTPAIRRTRVAAVGLLLALALLLVLGWERYFFRRRERPVADTRGALA